jgi:hypothetical protein
MMGFFEIWPEKNQELHHNSVGIEIQAEHAESILYLLKSIMQLTETIFSDSVIFIVKKREENRLWRKSAFCGEKVKNAGGKKKIHLREGFRRLPGGVPLPGHPGPYALA